MTTTPFSTVIGVFADLQQANRAIDELRRADFSYGRIRVVERGTGTFKDTLKGLFTGQASTASNTADDLMKMGMPEQDAHYYQRELDAGRIIVIMNADDRPEQAFNIMRQSGSFDINGHLKIDQPNVPAGAYNPQANATPAPGTPNPNVPPPPPNQTMPPTAPPPNAPPAYTTNTSWGGTPNPGMPPESPPQR